MANRIRYAAQTAAARYAKQIGNCPLYLFQNDATGALSVGVTCPEGFCLAAKDPIPNIGETAIEAWMADALNPPTTAQKAAFIRAQARKGWRK